VAPVAGDGSCRPRRPASRDTGHDLTTTGRPTARHTDATRAHERLTRIQEELRRVRATERVLAEQVAHLDAVAADAKTRKLVAQTPLADRDWRAARTDRDRHRVLLEEARSEADELRAEQDRLLDRLLAGDPEPPWRDDP